MKNKRILIASWTFYPAWSYGGIARVMYELAIQYQKDWYEVDCITTDVFDEKKRYNKTKEVINWLKIYYFKNMSNVIANKLKFPTPLWLKKRLKNNIKEYDIIHIADFRNIFNHEIYIQCKKNKIPYIVSPFWCVPYEIDLKFPIKKAFDLIRSKNMMMEAKHVTVQTQSEFEELLKFGVDRNKIKLIPLMVDYTKFKTLPKVWFIREEYRISEKAKILLFVWRIHKYKATDMMVDCFFDYQKQIPDSYLIIIWRDDGYENHLKEYVKKLGIDKKVLFVWAVYYPESLNYYVDADIYFMAPSHREETSTASLEALACGTPVVISEQADIPFINDYNAGYITKFSRNDITKKLLKIKDKDSQSCQKLIEDHFDIKSIKNEFINLYF